MKNIDHMSIGFFKTNLIQSFKYCTSRIIVKSAFEIAVFQGKPIGTLTVDGGKRKRTMLCLRESVPVLGSADDRFLETRKSGVVHGRSDARMCMRAHESVAPRRAGLCGARTLWETG